MNQPLKWHGGKHYLAKRIVELMPPHTRYLEAYAGGLSVLLNKPYKGVSEYVNDTNWELTNFWATLRSNTQFEKFHRWCSCQPLSEQAFETAIEYRPFVVHDDADAWAAYQFFVKMRMSRQGLGDDYCTPTSRTRRGMNENVSAWLSAVDGLPEIHERLRRVEVWNRPAVDAIRALDSSDLFAYLDPPYVQSTRKAKAAYKNHEMSDSQHKELLNVIASMNGKFMLSGYHNPMYDDMADLFGWRCVEFNLPNHASSAGTKERKIECVWMNY